MIYISYIFLYYLLLSYVILINLDSIVIWYDMVWQNTAMPACFFFLQPHQQVRRNAPITHHHTSTMVGTKDICRPPHLASPGEAGCTGLARTQAANFCTSGFKVAAIL